MGMPIIVDIRDTDIDAGCVDAVFAWFRLVDDVFSTYKPASQISRLNRGEITIHDAGEDLQGVLQRCEELRGETDGYFDVRAASRDLVDPSGFVKGWSVDRATSLLDEVGARNYSINAGGDVAVRGGALPQPQWRIGIQHPKRRDSIARVLTSRHLAVATSGSYERGAHVVDPLTGLAPTGVLSVTVAGPELAIADAYATAAYAHGPRSAEWTRELPARGYEALTILPDQTVLVTPGFPAA
jgi:FAD:protein FMN transferase